MSETQLNDVLTVSRDEDGELLGEQGHVTYRGDSLEFEVVPMNLGQTKKYERLGADFDEMNVEAFEFIFENHAPGLEYENIEDIKMGLGSQIVMEIMQISGFNVGAEEAQQIQQRFEEAQEVQEGN